MILKILISLAAIVAVLAVVIAMRPTEFRVERTVTMAAPAPVVFAQVNDPQVGRVVPLCQARSRDEEELRGRARRRGRDLHLVR